MDLPDKIKLTAKTIEGKIQETVGEIIGNPEIAAEGEKKLADAQAELSEKAEDKQDKQDNIISISENQNQEVIEQSKTFEGNDKIEQASSFEEAKRSSK